MNENALKYFQIAYKHQINGEFDEAVINYKRSLEIEQTAEGYTFLGWTLSFMGKLDEAIDACHKAIAIDPDFGNPYNDIGAYLLQTGKVDEPVFWFKKAIKAKRYENREFAYMNLGKVYELKGLWPHAITEYKSAVKLNPNYRPALDSLERLMINLN